MAEREGFEPPVPFRVQWFSRPPPSTARPSLRAQHPNLLQFTAHDVAIANGRVAEVFPRLPTPTRTKDRLYTAWLGVCSAYASDRTDDSTAHRLGKRRVAGLLPPGPG